jgi:SNF2 family DNA or RNA helicase
MHKGCVTVLVSSDIDWFNAKIKLQYGGQTASLKEIQKSVKNKSKFVQLGDGTLGILPSEWMARFAEFFQSGDIVDNEILIPKSRFMEINELFGEEVLDKEARNDLARYMQKFSDFEGIPDVEVPKEFQGTLRDYQRHGLNWLNFLDEFHFGACLADDMGLGKTIQILALILVQRQKRSRNTNLIVVPTSLLFNWQAEAARFAPSIKLFTHYGSNRLKEPKDMDGYEIVLTTYGMLQNDIELLRKYEFNYIILDESQAIKNPESQRYKLARLLRSRNKIVLTGTPFENNTYDIYGQLSFACPGLLGSKAYFKNIYSNPIDKLEDGGKSTRLQRIIHPFVLRRTKRQVAKELPEKTEMVLYCEMGPQKRQLYEEEQKKVRDMLLHKNSKRNPSERIAKPPLYFLKGLTKLRQICDSPKLIDEGGAFEGENSAKIEVLMEQITSKSPQHKILVFSQFVTMLDLIKTELEAINIPFAYLTGQTRDRAAQVNEFQGNEAVRVFLISLKAGGIGLNLTEADYVYLVDPWWNPAVENQAIDRCYRIGQAKNVVAIKLICPNTIEEKIMLLQEKKHRLGSEIIHTDEEILKSLSRDELLAMLR